VSPASTFSMWRRADQPQLQAPHGLLLTLCWREMDSNLQYAGAVNLVVGPFGWVVLCDRVRSGRGASGTARYQRRGWAILAAGLGACRAGDGFPDATEAAQAKIFTSEMAIKVTNDALQLFGAAGYSRNPPLERMVRDARMFTIGAARRRSCARSWRRGFSAASCGNRAMVYVAKTGSE
jgi:hypothetical protein